MESMEGKLENPLKSLIKDKKITSNPISREIADKVYSNIANKMEETVLKFNEKATDSQIEASEIFLTH